MVVDEKTENPSRSKTRTYHGRSVRLRYCDEPYGSICLWDWLATQYVTALNVIHYMHDKYSYEAALMALHDRDVYRTGAACGIRRSICCG